MKHPRNAFLFAILKVFIGLTVFAYGIHLTIAADIGVAPWDCFAQGIAAHSPLNYGAAMTVVSVCVLLIDLLLRQPIGYGIIIDALYTGNAIQFFNDHASLSNRLIPEILHFRGLSAVLAGCVLIVIGLVFVSVGQVIYMGAGLSCGPRDSMLVGLGKRLPSIPIGLIQNAILLIVFIAGWLLGGSIGIGTLLTVVCTGVVMQIIFKLMHYDPRNTRHAGLVESTRTLIRNT